MQIKIGTEVELGATVSAFDSIVASSAIDRLASNFQMQEKRYKKLEN